MKLLRRTTFSDYLEEIRPRLEAIEKVESKPKVIPRIFEFWKEPEAFRGMVGWPSSPSSNLRTQQSTKKHPQNDRMPLPA